MITAYDLAGTSRGISQTQKKEAAMSKQNLPEGWDGEKVRRVLAHYQQEGEEAALIEDEAGVESSETVMSVPRELVPKVRELIAKFSRS